MKMEKVITVLKEKDQKLCVVATVAPDGSPTCAVMGYAIRDDGTVILSTHTNSRKWQNIAKNPSVALVFGWEFTGYNIQMQGQAHLVSDGEAFSEIEAFFFSVNPQAKKFQTPETGFITVVPAWVRLTDFSEGPPKITEQSMA